MMKIPIHDIAVAAFNEMAPERKELGLEKYGVELKTFDGRDTYVDALQELFDCWMYVVKAMKEEEALSFRIADLEYKNKLLTDQLECARMGKSGG